MQVGFRRAEDVVVLPWAALRRYLAAEGFVMSDAEPRQFAGGMGNLNYLIEIDGNPHVLRRPPLGPIPPGANDMRREHRVLRRLWRVFALAPRSVVFCADEQVIGAPFLIMEYRDGVAISGAQLPHSLDDPASARALTEMLIRILADLHAVAPEELGLADFGRPDGFLQRAVEGWTKRALLATDNAPPPAVGPVRDWLRAQYPPRVTPTLLHNDFKLDNVLMARDDLTTPVAVIDWDQATRGDPLFDLATLLSYWTETTDPDAMRQLRQMPTARPGALSRRDAMELYTELTGRDLSAFKFHRVLAMYKLGIVFIQLHAQYRRGTVADDRYEPFGRIGSGIIDFAHEVVLDRLA